MLVSTAFRDSTLARTEPIPRIAGAASPAIESAKSAEHGDALKTLNKFIPRNAIRFPIKFLVAKAYPYNFALRALFLPVCSLFSIHSLTLSLAQST
jgi:hypothetical protein